jgi:hypothetical protein
MPRAALPLLLTLGLGACTLPRPAAIEATFERGPEEVTVQVELRDLRVPADELAALEALGALATPERARAYSDAPWLHTVDRWALVTEGGQVHLRFTARAKRAVFDACLAAPCEGDGKDGCAFLPLRQACPKVIFDELAADKEDPYVDTGRTTMTWPADAKRLVVSLARRAPSPEYPQPAQATAALLANDGALPTLKWLDDLEAAAAADDLDAWRRLADADPPAAGALGALAAESLRRHRERLWYETLAAHDPRWLVAPPTAHWMKSGRSLTRHDRPAAKPALPGPWLWRARAAYEIARHSPAARAELDPELCRAPEVKRSRGVQRLCRFMGVAPAATGKGKAK